MASIGLLLWRRRSRRRNHLSIHKEHDKFLYVLEGRGWVHIGDEEVRVEVGDFVYCSVGVKHSFFMLIKRSGLSIYALLFDSVYPDMLFPQR
jgi:uncharacterized cupin superfamily protein